LKKIFNLRHSLVTFHHLFDHLKGKIMSESENRDFQREIHQQQIVVNQLNERLTFEIPARLEFARKELLCAECSDTIRAGFEKLAGAEAEQKKLILLIRQAEIKLSKLVLESAAIEATKARHDYEAALAELPTAQAALDAAQLVFDQLAARIYRLEGRATDGERSARRAEQVFAELQNAPLTI
jgi:hypothetical protein